MANEADDWIVPDGIAIRDLALRADERGSLTEIFRQSWSSAFQPVQWNASRSEARVLRGVHIHRRHTDYFVVLAGAMLLGLHDIRLTSPTRGRSVLLPLDGNAPRAVAIPPGVAHGFYFLEPCVHLCGVDQYWDGSDEIGCRFDSPELDLSWPNLAPILSTRDSQAGSYSEMARQFFGRSEANGNDRE
jgi:dTDP-4-dehydrorhamnose 3,5-epimerase